MEIFELHAIVLLQLREKKVHVVLILRRTAPLAVSATDTYEA